MAPRELKQWKKIVDRIFQKGEEVLLGDLSPMFEKFYATNAKALLAFAKKHPTPFYVFDRKELQHSIKEFTAAFNRHIPRASYYYAVKSNWHPYILEEVVKRGMHLDISSGRELRLALDAKAKKMVFSGPGKSDEELLLALKHHGTVTVHLDSFNELEKLGKLADRVKKEITVGVRIYTESHTVWNKFGIPLTRLAAFFNAAKKYPWLKLAGIQTHLSLNETQAPYQDIIAKIAAQLRRFTSKELQQIKFIDLGGGFLPHQTTAVYPWWTAEGDMIKIAADYAERSPVFKYDYFLNESVSAETYAKGIGDAIKKYFEPLGLACEYYFEPGRIICNNAMHIVLGVADVKEDNKIILDGGVNLVGWEGLRYEYTPLINLSHFSKKEKPMTVYGNLCMADDVWGYGVYAKHVKVGDVLAIPFQGAYTYALAQEFIKGIPPVYRLGY